MVSGGVTFDPEATAVVRTWKGLPISIAYQRIRPAATSANQLPPLLLIQGLGEQMIGWDDAFCATVATRMGCEVVRYDNRDVGLSSKVDGDGESADYGILDMADDAIALADKIGIKGRFHVAGLSMGGMIAQEMLLRYGDRLASVAVIMSSGEPQADRGIRPTKRVSKVFFQRPTGHDAASMAAYRMLVWEHIFVPEGAWTPLLAAYAGAESARHAKRSTYFDGVARQFMAVVSAEPRLDRLLLIASPPPTVVIHGVDDGLVRASEGKSVADAIRGAKWVPVDGMAHRILPQHFEQVANAIIGNARSTTTRSKL